MRSIIKKALGVLQNRRLITFHFHCLQIQLIYNLKQFLTNHIFFKPNQHSIHQMEFKIKHKLTFDSPDTMSADLLRSNRKTKTMLRSFRGVNKDLGSYDIPSSNGDQKQITTLVDGKIQELHLKMKNFFNYERITHLQQIAPELQEIKTAIILLKDQLNRPKSMQQIEQEKHNLLKRKAELLKQIENTNTKVKGDKTHFYELKFQSEELNRQLKNAYATIQKYKQKLQARQNIQNQSRLINQSKGNQKDNSPNILNESLCDQNKSAHSDKLYVNKVSHKTTDHQTDNVHITEVTGQPYTLQNQKLAGELPLIDSSKKNKLSVYLGQELNRRNLNGTQKGSMLKNSFSMTPKMMRKTKKTQFSYVFQNQRTQLSKQCTTISNNSFDEYLRHNTVQTTQNGLQHNYKYSKKNQYSLDLSSQIKKYEQLVNREKWSKVNRLFAQLNNRDARKIALPKTDGDQTTVQGKDYGHINELQELLMQEMRKEQFFSFKQKGYHEGLKDKTHQIRIQFKRIFKNYQADELFKSIIEKKPIKKQLALILQDSIQY